MYWRRLPGDLVTKHPAEASARVDIEGIIRTGIRRFTDEVGRLWCALADHYIRLANFEKARDVYVTCRLCD